MTRTLLIVIGIACAVIAAAGIMFYNPVSIARRQLYDKDPDVCWNAITNLFKIRGKASIPEFTRLLQSDNIVTRCLAAKALSYFGDKISIPEITKLLQDNEIVVRHSDICALVDLEGKKAIPNIKKLLNDKEEIIRQVAEYVLKKLGVPAEEIERAKSK